MGAVEVLENRIPELPPIKSPLRDSANEQSVPREFGGYCSCSLS